MKLLDDKGRPFDPASGKLPVAVEFNGLRIPLDAERAAAAVRGAKQRAAFLANDHAALTELRKEAAAVKVDRKAPFSLGGKKKKKGG
jgi:hypothetical protein